MKHTLSLSLLVCVSVLALLPLWIMGVLAFSDSGAVMQHHGLLWLPLKPSVHAFEVLFSDVRLGLALGNSIAVAVVATALHVLTSAMAGYALVHLPCVGRRWWTLGVFLTILVPPQVNSIPLFILFKQVGLLNSYVALILPAIVSGFGVMLFRQWFLSFPNALKEAAELEGASIWQTFCYIALPNAKSPMISLAVLGFISLWGSFLWPLLVIQDERLITLPVYLAQLKQQYRDVLDWPILMASAMLAILPIILFFIALQKPFFDQGSVTEGMK